MKSIKKLKNMNKKMIFIISLLFVLFVGGVVFAATSGESSTDVTGDISDTNPTLTWINMDSNAEQIVNSKPLYTPTGSLEQSGSIYKTSSNAYVAWETEDDIGYGYKQYAVSDKSGDWIEAEVTVDKAAGSSTGKALHHNASQGLMFRASTATDAAEVFLHLRGNKLVVVYRRYTGSAIGGTCTTSVMDTGYANCTFPVTLKMRKEGAVVYMSVKSSAYGDGWNDLKFPATMNTQGSVCVGLASHSCDQATSILSQYSNLKIKGYGSGTISGGNDDVVVEEKVNEDPSATSDMLLFETFSDGDLTNTTPVGVNNPVWENPTVTEMKTVDGNRFWDRDFRDGVDFVGDRSWTDYSTSVDIQFTEHCNPDPDAANNAVRLYTRYKRHEAYGDTGYIVEVSEGYKIELHKASFIKSSMEQNGRDSSSLKASVNLREFLGDDDYSCLGDGKWHTLKVDTFDNVITVYWDGQKVIDAWEDDGTDTMLGEKVYAYGHIGIGCYQVSAYIDNIIVRELTDDFGGDYDNKIGGNWNTPIPDYINDYYKYDEDEK